MAVFTDTPHTSSDEFSLRSQNSSLSFAILNAFPNVDRLYKHMNINCLQYSIQITAINFPQHVKGKRLNITHLSTPLSYKTAMKHNWMHEQFYPLSIEVIFNSENPVYIPRQITVLFQSAWVLINNNACLLELRSQITNIARQKPIDKYDSILKNTSHCIYSYLQIQI